jgi:hypothetical protein
LHPLELVARGEDEHGAFDFLDGLQTGMDAGTKTELGKSLPEWAKSGGVEKTDIMLTESNLDLMPNGARLVVPATFHNSDTLYVYAVANLLTKGTVSLECRFPVDVRKPQSIREADASELKAVSIVRYEEKKHGQATPNSFFYPEAGMLTFSRVGGLNDIVVIDIDEYGQERVLKNLTRTNHAAEYFPTLTGDKGKIVYSATSRLPGGEFEQFDIWIMDADGSNKMNLTSTKDRSECEYALLPGNKIVFSSCNVEQRRNAKNPWDTIYKIWVMNLDGTGKTYLAQTRGDSYVCLLESGRIAFAEVTPDTNKTEYVIELGTR